MNTYQVLVKGQNGVLKVNADGFATQNHASVPGGASNNALVFFRQAATPVTVAAFAITEVQGWVLIPPTGP